MAYSQTSVKAGDDEEEKAEEAPTMEVEQEDAPSAKAQGPIAFQEEGVF